jgi:hypothetical protein
MAAFSVEGVSITPKEGVEGNDELGLSIVTKLAEKGGADSLIDRYRHIQSQKLEYARGVRVGRFEGARLIISNYYTEGKVQESRSAMVGGFLCQNEYAFLLLLSIFSQGSMIRFCKKSRQINFLGTISMIRAMMTRI